MNLIYYPTVVAAAACGCRLLSIFLATAGAHELKRARKHLRRLYPHRARRGRQERPGPERRRDCVRGLRRGLELGRCRDRVGLRSGIWDLRSGMWGLEA